MRYITDMLKRKSTIASLHVNDIHIICLCKKISAMWYKKKKLSIYKQHLMDFKSSDSYHSQMQYTLRNTEYRDLIVLGLKKNYIA